MKYLILKNVVVAGSFLLLSGLSSHAYPYVENGSFEADSYAAPYTSNNGGILTGWTVKGGAGLNPTSSGSRDFANNGKIPDGRQVAFMQQGSAADPCIFSQKIKGFAANKTYRVSYSYNVRVVSGIDGITFSVKLGGVVLDDPFPATNVEAANSFTKDYPRRTTSRAFTAPADGEYELQLISYVTPGAFPDSSALWDHIVIFQDPPDPNVPPVFDPIPDQFTHTDFPLRFFIRATDPNVEPPQTLQYSLGTNAPANAYIDPSTGEFSWVPTAAEAGIRKITVKATDDGTPVKSATKDFNVLSAPIRLDSVERTPAGTLLKWKAMTGASYRVEYKDDFNSPQWKLLREVIFENGEGTYTDDSANGQVRFYRLQGSSSF